MLTFIGKGYNAAFVANYMALARRLSEGEAIEIVSGPDDICRPLQSGDKAHCRLESVVRRDDLATAAVARLLGRSVRAGDRIRPGRTLIRRFREAFAEGSLRTACHGCRWSELCSVVAASGFAEVRVLGSAVKAETATRTCVPLPA
jgi:hypothetical protein